MQLTDNNQKFTDEQLLFYLSLSRISFLKCCEKEILRKNIDSSQSLALLSMEDIEKIVGRTMNAKALWNGAENLRMAEIALQRCKNLNIKLLLFFDSDYPEILRQISDPPYLIFCRGNHQLLKEKSVSVVGSRRLSQNGKKAAFGFAFDAAKNSFNVVSGLASGADGFAHQGAVDAYFDTLEKEEDLSKLGRTIAVLPSAIDEIVPSVNKRLAGQILQTGGCLISEYEPQLQTARWHFVERNRIIAGLSLATVVIEAPPGSGSLITADFALDYNRDVVFHESAFSEMAEKISEGVKMQIQKSLNEGKVSRYKAENTISRFLEAGAPVIKDFSDFRQCIMQAPGTHRNAFQQNFLFG